MLEDPDETLRPLAVEDDRGFYGNSGQPRRRCVSLLDYTSFQDCAYVRTHGTQSRSGRVRIQSFPW
jgi:hypothetical protein